MHPQAQGLGLSLDMEKNMKTGSVLVQRTNTLRVPPGLLILKECTFEAPMGGVTGARVGFEEGVSAGGIHMLHAVYHLFILSVFLTLDTTTANGRPMKKSSLKNSRRD